MCHYVDSKVASVIPNPSPPDPTSVNSPSDVIATLLADKRGLHRPFQIQIQIQFQIPVSIPVPISISISSGVNHYPDEDQTLKPASTIGILRTRRPVAA